MTPKANMEVEKLNAKIVSLNLEKAEWEDRANQSKDYQLKKLSWKESHKVSDKIYRVEEKIRTLESDGISTSEKNALAKEAWNKFTTIQRDTSLGAKGYTKIGFSQTLKAFVRVELTRWSGFMSNVQGCASMANKKQLDRFEIITQEEYDAIINKGIVKVETSFMGHEQKEVPLHVGS